MDLMGALYYLIQEPATLHDNNLVLTIRKLKAQKDHLLEVIKKFFSCL